MHGFSVISDLSFGLARIGCLLRAQAKQSPYSSGEPLFSLLQDTGNPGQRYPYKLCLRPGLSSSDIFNISRLLLRLLQGLLRAHGSYGTRLLIHIAQIILTVIRTRAVPVGKDKGVVA